MREVGTPIMSKHFQTSIIFLQPICNNLQRRLKNLQHIIYGATDKHSIGVPNSRGTPTSSDRFQTSTIFLQPICNNLQRRLKHLQLYPFPGKSDFPILVLNSRYNYLNNIYFFIKLYFLMIYNFVYQLCY